MHTLRYAEQAQCLVEQVRAEVEPQPGAGQVVFAPAVADLRTEALDGRLEVAHRADAAGLQGGLHGEEVAVEAPVLEHREDLPRPFTGEVGEARASARVTVNGLSTTTCLPARKARSARLAWVALGEAMTTRSMSAASMASSGSALTRASGRSACTRPGSRETTCSRHNAGTARISGAWKVLPAKP